MEQSGEGYATSSCGGDVTVGHGGFPGLEPPNVELSVASVMEGCCVFDSTDGVVAPGVVLGESVSSLSMVVVVVFTCVKSDMGEPVKIVAKSSSSTSRK